MFNSVIIDVAIGMTLTFLAVSLAASAVTEAISSALKWRQSTLLAGIQDLLNDPNFDGMARQLYNHALVNPLSSGVAKTVKDLTATPAYIDPRGFALALYDTLGKDAGPGASPDDIIAKISDPQLKNAMTALWNTASKDLEQFKHNLGEWFDGAMDRVGGRYKRNTQLVSFLVALFIAALFNVNTLYLSAQIWSRPGAIAEISAVQFDQKTDRSADDVKKIMDALESKYLVGWVQGPAPFDPQSWFIALTSWLLVAASALFGASFWFDMLQKIVQLKGTGNEPKRADAGTSQRT